MSKAARRARTISACIGLCLAAAISTASAADPTRWIGTWSASPQPVWDTDFFAPIKYPRTLWNQTVRQVARVSIGGARIRVVLSNEYGSRPVLIGAAHVALADKGPAIAAGSDRVLTFGGSRTAVIPPGAPLLSDPVDLPVAPLAWR